MAKYMIIGGVAGGATAAARLRRLDEKAEIILLERGDYISYANCGLPYYAGGVIKERSKLFVMTPEKFRATLAVDVRTGHEATSDRRKGKTVAILEKATGRTYSESYDALVLSPGAEPVKPPIPGIDDESIFTLRSVPDIDAIKEHIDAQAPRAGGRHRRGLHRPRDGGEPARARGLRDDRRSPRPSHERHRSRDGRDRASAHQGQGRRALPLRFRDGLRAKGRQDRSEAQVRARICPPTW